MNLNAVAGYMERCSQIPVSTLAESLAPGSSMTDTMTSQGTALDRAVEHTGRMPLDREDPEKLNGPVEIIRKK